MSADAASTPTPLLDALARSKDKRVANVGKVVKFQLGRPTSLTEGTARVIVKAVLEGNYLNTACQAAGITKRTLSNWRARAREIMEDEEVGSLAEVPETERIFVEFFLALKAAEAQAEGALLRRAMRGEKGWQAAMTVLERRHPEYWGRSEKRIHEGNEEKPLVLEVAPQGERVQRVARILEDQQVLEGTARELGPGAPDA